MGNEMLVHVVGRYTQTEELFLELLFSQLG